MQTRQLIRQTIKKLREARDEKRKEWAPTYYPSAMEIIGVRVPDQRAVLKDLQKEIREEPPESILQLARQLVDTGIFECQQIAYELLDRNKKAVSLIGHQELLSLGRNLDNWVSVDTFSCYLAGVAWREGQIPDKVVIDWAHSENRWIRRAAVVSTIALNQKARGGTGDAEKTLMVCRLVASDSDDMVAKALSWALKELSKREPEPVRAFLEEHGDVLPARVAREVRKKLETF